MSIRYETVRVLRKFFSTITHSHGNVSSDGKIGNASGKIITTGQNGVLQASDTITKDKISDFPTTIPPSSHTHRKSEITDFSHTHTKSEISDFPSTMTPSSHAHGAVNDNGTINNDTSNVGKVVVTDNENNLRTINQLPFAKLSISKSNITGLGIPAQDTTYNAGTGLNKTGTTFAVEDIPNTEVLHTIDSNSDFKYINGGTSAPIGTIYTQKVINEYINARLGELFGSLELSSVTKDYTQLSESKYKSGSYVKFTKIGRLVLVDYHLTGASSLIKGFFHHICNFPEGYAPATTGLYSNWAIAGSRGQIRVTQENGEYVLKLYIFDNDCSGLMAGQLVYFLEE